MLIRKDLIREAGGKCQGCGERFSTKLNETQLALHGELAIDFKVPLKRGGTVELKNAQVLCWPCFHGKNRTNLTNAEWRALGRPQGGIKLPQSPWA